ncbi:MAG: DbpA RNA binding domain-containing protein [Sphaerochaetaceae bacterium]
MDNEKTKPDKDQAFIAKIQIIAGKTKADANPDELEHLKKLIKKNVPFSLRGYFMAYLLREGMSTKENFKRPIATNARPVAKKEQAPSEAEKPEERAVEKPLPAGAKTLYLNIGKMKRLYAKELSQVFQTELGLTRDDIYSIRIHDKYSFVSMSQENCEKAIAKINGMDIKGRTVTVSYSNKE